jgi:hypothetical protein
MTVSRWILITVLYATVGCAGSKDNDGQPTRQEDWREKKRLAEVRAKAEVIKEELRRLQRELNVKDTQKLAKSENGKTKWRPHEDYLGDPKYRTLYTELSSIVETHNSILDQDPTLKASRLDLKLD